MTIEQSTAIFDIDAEVDDGATIPKRDARRHVPRPPHREGIDLGISEGGSYVHFGDEFGWMNQ
jgi:hypothetical protein